MWTLTILLCVFSLHLGGMAADLSGREKQPDMPCKAAVSLLLKRQMAGIGKCSKTMKFKNGKDKAAKMSVINIMRTIHSGSSGFAMARNDLPACSHKIMYIWNLLAMSRTKVASSKLRCILKCVMVTEGILLPSGEIDPPTLDEFALKNIPGNLWDKAYPLMLECFDGVVVDPKEEFCKSYDPIIKCVLDNIPKFCK